MQSPHIQIRLVKYSWIACQLEVGIPIITFAVVEVSDSSELPQFVGEIFFSWLRK